MLALHCNPATKVLMQAREKSQLILGEWGLAMQWTIDNSNLRFESHQDWQ